MQLDLSIVVERLHKLFDGYRELALYAVVYGYLALNVQLIHSILSERKYRDTLTLASKLLQAAAKASIDP